MSGIAGLLFRDGRPADSNTAGKMLHALAARGPDGHGVWCEGSAALGHRMLHSTPESTQEILPFVDTVRNLTITSDARVDNRDELIRALGLSQRSAVPIPDSQVILAAYAKWGSACAEHLLGDFAFVIWDRRKKQLFCARDQVGVKPFCYHLSDRAFYFASEIKALLEVDDIPRRLNETKMAHYLMSANLSQEYTFFQDISRLPPGHFLVIDERQSRVQSYWAPDPSRQISPRSNHEYAEAFRDIFTDAVRCRLRSSVPAAALLSGGLDSSAIACVARRLMAASDQGPLTTFSMVFEHGSDCDETPYIRAVLDAGRFNSHLIRFDHVNHRPITDAQRVLRYQDEPVFAPNCSQPLQLLSAISRAGTRVILDGHGGDETISSGASYLKQLARGHQWMTLAGELRAVSGRWEQQWLSLLWQYVVFGVQPLVSRFRLLRFGRRVLRAGKSRVRAFFPDDASSASAIALASVAVAKRTESSSAYQAWRSNARSFRSERDDHSETIRQPAQATALEALDAMASALSLELRFPFWDRRVVDFCLALPPTQKFSDGWGRLILRRSMEGILPPTIQWRHDKTDFMPNVVRGLLANDLKEVARLGRGIEVLGDIVDVTAVRALITRINHGNPAAVDLLALSRIATLYYWFESGKGKLLR